MSYFVTATELLIGIFMLPFNVAYLGQDAYGLWVLVASLTVYFSMLDMGFGLALVKSTAEYRAKGDAEGLNQIVSTVFCVFGAIGLLSFGVAVLLSFHLALFFKLTLDQAAIGQPVLLLISAFVALGFPASVFGGIVNGFQRNYLNGIVAFLTAVVCAVVNVVVLVAGYGLVELVVATTTVRIISYFGYALNAYRVFPKLRLRPRRFSFVRLREVTGFSVFMLLIDLANKLNYSTDTVVIGAFVGVSGVAVWAVAQRLIEVVQRITNQLNGALFPVVVDSSTLQNDLRLQRILLQGTRLSLAMVIPLATVLALLAEPLVLTWVGPDFVGSVPVIYILAVAVATRVGSATSTTILKGSGHHKLLAFSNVAMALVNLILSIWLVRHYGLLGVALGTLIPLALISAVVLFPAACRRVKMSGREVIWKAVWPATWPAIIMASVLIVCKSFVNLNWPLLFLLSISAAIIYLTLFLRLAISEPERKWYFDKGRELFRASRRPAQAETSLTLQI